MLCSAHICKCANAKRKPFSSIIQIRILWIIWFYGTFSKSRNKCSECRRNNIRRAILVGHSCAPSLISVYSFCIFSLNPCNNLWYGWVVYFIRSLSYWLAIEISDSAKSIDGKNACRTNIYVIRFIYTNLCDILAGLFCGEILCGTGHVRYQRTVIFPYFREQWKWLLKSIHIEFHEQRMLQICFYSNDVMIKSIDSFESVCIMFVRANGKTVCMCVSDFLALILSTVWNATVIWSVLSWWIKKNSESVYAIGLFCEVNLYHMLHVRCIRDTFCFYQRNRKVHTASKTTNYCCLYLLFVCVPLCIQCKMCACVCGLKIISFQTESAGLWFFGMVL